jgi:hypothetical protein
MNPDPDSMNVLLRDRNPPVWPGGGEENSRVSHAEPLVPRFAPHNFLVKNLPRLVPVKHAKPNISIVRVSNTKYL